MSKNNGQTHARVLNPAGLLFPVIREHKAIDWPTEHQLEEVARRLAAIKHRAARSEAEGDYFTSGDLAYQLHEIIRTTEQLFAKSQRLKR